MAPSGAPICCPVSCVASAPQGLSKVQFHPVPLFQTSILELRLSLVQNQKEKKEKSAHQKQTFVLRILASDSPGGPVDKNPAASAGDMGLIPLPGRFHMLQN